MTASAAGTSNVYPPVISVTIISVATGTWAAPANTAAAPTITNGAAGWCETLASKPPNIAPADGVGATTAPDPPDETVRLLARGFDNTSARRVLAARRPSIASCIQP